MWSKFRWSALSQDRRWGRHVASCIFTRIIEVNLEMILIFFEMTQSIFEQTLFRLIQINPITPEETHCTTILHSSVRVTLIPAVGHGQIFAKGARFCHTMEKFHSTSRPVALLCDAPTATAQPARNELENL